MLAGPAPGMEAGRLEHGADVTDRLVEVAVWLTVDGCRAGRRGHQPEQHPQRRGLPGAVGAEEPDDPAGRELHGEVVDGDDVAEAFGETVEGDDRHGSMSSRFGRYRGSMPADGDGTDRAARRRRAGAWLLISLGQ